VNADTSIRWDCVRFAPLAATPRRRLVVNSKTNQIVIEHLCSSIKQILLNVLTLETVTLWIKWTGGEKAVQIGSLSHQHWNAAINPESATFP
jgi:hypothetical protein